MQGNTPFVVVSVDKTDLSPEINLSRQHTFERQLYARDLSFKRVEGVYKGAREIAYVVPLDHEGDEDKVLVLAQRYGQESVLQVDFNRYAMLLYLREAGEPIVKSFEGVGHWRELA